MWSQLCILFSKSINENELGRGVAFPGSKTKHGGLPQAHKEAAIESKVSFWSSRCGAVVNKSDWEPWGCGFDPWPCSVGWGPSIAVSYGVGCRLGSDPVLLWLWCRPAAAASGRPLAWGPPYATGTTLEKPNDQKKRKFYWLGIFKSSKISSLCKKFWDTFST